MFLQFGIFAAFITTDLSIFGGVFKNLSSHFVLFFYFFESFIFVERIQTIGFNYLFVVILMDVFFISLAAKVVYMLLCYCLVDHFFTVTFCHRYSLPSISLSKLSTFFLASLFIALHCTFGLSFLGHHLPHQSSRIFNL